MNKLILVDDMHHNEFKFRSNLEEPIITYGSTRDYRTYFESTPCMNIIYKDL